MNDLALFFSQYGLVLTLIAMLGIVLLGLLKYFGLFKRLKETDRHYAYITVSVAFSILSSIVYLIIVHSFSFQYIITISLAILALNQTFYNIFKITPINKLMRTLFDMFISYFKSTSDISED